MAAPADPARMLWFFDYARIIIVHAALISGADPIALLTSPAVRSKKISTSCR
jgi:hypothetical protein